MVYNHMKNILKTILEKVLTLKMFKGILVYNVEEIETKINCV